VVISQNAPAIVYQIKPAFIPLPFDQIFNPLFWGFCIDGGLLWGLVCYKKLKNGPGSKKGLRFTTFGAL